MSVGTVVRKLHKVAVSAEAIDLAKPIKTRQELPPLSIEQLNAIDLLVTGLSDREVSEKVGVARQTVTNWRLYNPIFQAELNRKRKEIWGSSGDRMRSLLPKALDRLEKTLMDDNDPNGWRAALEMVKSAGLYAKGGLGEIGEDDVRAIAKKAAEVVHWESLRGDSVAKIDDLLKEWIPSEEDIASELEKMQRKADSEVN
jgi:hypothetical protein